MLPRPVLSRPAVLRAVAVAGATALVAFTVTPANALVEPVDIEVIIASGTGPDAERKVFRTEDVTVGDGPELTEEDLVAPSTQCGAVEVDIDPEARTVTVSSTDTGCEAGMVVLRISSEELWNLRPEVTTNELVTWDPFIEGGWEPSGEGDPGDPRGLAVAWWASSTETLVLSGASVFSWEAVAPEPTPEPTPGPTPGPGPAPVTTPSPAPPTAAPARPVVARADFTG